MAKNKQKKGLLILFCVLITLLVVIVLLFQLFLPKFPCANSISCIKDLSGKYDQTKTSAEFMGQQMTVPPALFKDTALPLSVLGTRDKKGEKKIFVNLTTQRLYAYEGNKLIYTMVISSGKWNPTPVGKFYVWVKLLFTNMEGGDKENNTYYNFPNVPYTMYFYNENVGKWNGYGIHGAYWQIKFGEPASHGCVVLSISDAKKLYQWVDPYSATEVTYATNQNPGTPIFIFGKAPL